MHNESSTPYRLRILHISDLHERGQRETERWRRRCVLGPAWEQNLRQILDEGPVDLVCFTGDAADWGLADEYQAATDHFLGLLRQIQLSPGRLFLVPGNHDVHRKTQATAWTGLRKALNHGIDELALSRWMAGLAEPPAGCKATWRKAIFDRQAAYRAWLKCDLARHGLSPEVSDHDGLGYRATVKLPGYPFPIHLIGLDTAWLAGDDKDSGRLRLTDNQIMRHAADAGGKPLAGLRLALMHHPLSELADGAQCRQRLAEHVDLVLRGHLHETEVQTWADPDRQIRQLAAGCLYEGHRADQYPNACVLVTLHLNALGRPERIDLRFRTWSSNGHWYDDSSLYRESRNGRLTWRFEAPRMPDDDYNPCDPWTPVIPPRFVGRRALTQAFETAMQTGRGISVLGDWRIGKSSLLRTWYQQAKDAGRTVRILSGEGPEGASPDAFVGAITGLPVAGDVETIANVLKSWAGSVSAPGLPPIVIVDEADSMMSRFPYRFWERLRDMIGRICLVLASRRPIDLIYKDLSESSPFQNRLEPRWVGLLEPTDTEQLIATWRLFIRPEDEDLVLEWAGRHPYYLALLGHYLVVARQRSEPACDALDLFLAASDARLRELWNALLPHYREALLAAHSGKAVNPAHRRHLRERGLLDSDGKPFGRVLAEWLRYQATEERST